MDRDTTLAEHRTAGFPRPRGDGPASRGRPPRPGEVSPPTRGWTELIRPGRLARYGFPAHAGMDLDHDSVRSVRSWFPRPRGDGPYARPAAAGAHRVSPPTRGWTRVEEDALTGVAGFPAHAGMDPSDRSERVAYPGFPRPRGDGPQSTRRSPVVHWVSPPTRGWTLLYYLAGGHRRGFPAHAGMDLAPSMYHCASGGFPRPRGDGPTLPVLAARYGEVSPPTRGWTPATNHGARSLVGFPAHAGMDLAGWVFVMSCAWFPRPRGDGPPGCTGRSLRRRVSPPTRGWTACNLCGAGCWGGGSPPTRGWTQRISHAGADAKGFPAHAGMDLSRRQDRSAGSWFPRPRGDGPFWCAGPFSSPRVSPPTRGWTHDTVSAVGLLRVSPPTRGWTHLPWIW